MSEQKKRELYEELSQKQCRTAKLIVLAVLGGIGLLFLILGAVFYFTGLTDPDSDVALWIVFVPLGAFLLCLGLLLYAVLPKRGNYDKFCARVEKNGGINAFNRFNYYDSYIALRLAQEELAELDKRMTELEKHKNDDR